MDEFIYDQNDNLIVHVKPGQEITAFFYDDSKVVQTFSNQSGWSRLHYDSNGHIYAIDAKNETFFIASDIAGSPMAMFLSNGSLAMQLEQTPFGLILDGDSNLPIGYQGGIPIPEAGIVIFKGNKVYDTHLGQWMIPDLSFIQDVHSKSWTDINSIHAYRFKNNDPLNSKVTSYMDKYEDWLRALSIQTPLDLVKSPSIFTQVFIEKDFDLGKHERRQKLSNGISTGPQLLGPNVILQLDDESMQISAKLLQGAGTVEQILAKLVNSSTLMPINMKKPQLISFYTGQDLILDEHEVGILQKSTKMKRMSVADKTFFIDVDAYKFHMIFWIGFESLDVAQSTRQKIEESQ